VTVGAPGTVSSLFSGYPRRSRFLLVLFVVAAMGPVHSTGLAAQRAGATLFREITWRSLGPMSGGRTPAVAGVPSRPGVFYAGASNGGLWKTTDYGRVWAPVFDAQSTGAIGAIAVSPSHPEVVYVGGGDAGHGDALAGGNGIHKSVDGGASWTQLGLQESQRIAAIVIDPRNPDRLFVAAAGHAHGSNAERGLYRSLDGGSSFTRILGGDSTVGAVDVILDPIDANIIYAALLDARETASTGLHKSIDGGTTWRRLTQGLPTVLEGLGAIRLAGAPGLQSRLYAVAEVKGREAVYRSDDAGNTWRPLPGAVGVREIRVDPRSPDVLYAAGDAITRSLDAGRTWTVLRGSLPGGWYRTIRVDPATPWVLVAGSDHGAVISVNGGETWSSTANQPTGRFVQVAAGNAALGRICASSEQGPVCGSLDGNWTPAGREGPVVPDPRDPEVWYSGWVTRVDRGTGVIRNIGPAVEVTGSPANIPSRSLAFSPADSTTLFLGGDGVWRSGDGGTSWSSIGDPLRSDSAPGGNEIRILAPSARATRWLWAGSGEGTVHLTRDGGGTWQRVTPRGVRPGSRVSGLEASPFDTLTAWVAVDATDRDDLDPHLHRTRDGGRSWTAVIRGLPSGVVVHSVRADPVRRGLLYAGTGDGVYVSFDEGDGWLPLRSGLPPTGYRDLAVAGHALVAATDGRGLWALDDVTPLRQLTGAHLAASAHLFAPLPVRRARSRLQIISPPTDDAVVPPRPDGVMLHWFLRNRAPGDLVLEIRNDRDDVVRRFSSEDDGPGPHPSDAPGLHRFLWDLRHASPDPTAEGVRGTRVPPGRYIVRLSTGVETLTVPLQIEADRRRTPTIDDLPRQYAISREIDSTLRLVAGARSSRGATGADREVTPVTERALEEELETAWRGLLRMFVLVEESDAAPSPEVQRRITALRRAARDLVARRR